MNDLIQYAGECVIAKARRRIKPPKSKRHPTDFKGIYQDKLRQNKNLRNIDAFFSQFENPVKKARTMYFGGVRTRIPSTSADRYRDTLAGDIKARKLGHRLPGTDAHKNNLYANKMIRNEKARMLRWSKNRTDIPRSENPSYLAALDFIRANNKGLSKMPRWNSNAHIDMLYRKKKPGQMLGDLIGDKYPEGTRKVSKATLSGVLGAKKRRVKMLDRAGIKPGSKTRRRIESKLMGNDELYARMGAGMSYDAARAALKKARYTANLSGHSLRMPQTMTMKQFDKMDKWLSKNEWKYGNMLPEDQMKWIRRMQMQNLKWGRMAKRGELGTGASPADAKFYDAAKKTMRDLRGVTGQKLDFQQIRDEEAARQRTYRRRGHRPRR